MSCTVVKTHVQNTCTHMTTYSALNYSVPIETVSLGKHSQSNYGHSRNSCMTQTAMHEGPHAWLSVSCNYYVIQSTVFNMEL